MKCLKYQPEIRDSPHWAPFLSSSPQFSGHTTGQQFATEFPLEFKRPAERSPDHVDAQVNFRGLAIRIRLQGCAIEDDSPLPHGFDHLKLHSSCIKWLLTLDIRNQCVWSICYNKDVNKYLSLKSLTWINYWVVDMMFHQEPRVIRKPEPAGLSSGLWRFSKVYHHHLYHKQAFHLMPKTS